MQVLVYQQTDKLELKWSETKLMMVIPISMYMRRMITSFKVGALCFTVLPPLTIITL